MRADLTDLTVVLDRSGSMATCRTEAENGLNRFVGEQKKQPGECLFSMVQFDTAYEFIHRGTPLANVGHLTLEPRGMTALLDAVGRAINETGERLNAIPEESRPGLVVFVIVTDGEENSSREFNKTQIKEMVRRRQDQYKWQFTFLGANQDAFAEAAAMGIPPQQAANYTPQKSDQAFTEASNNVSRMRAACYAGQVVSCNYTDAQRAAMWKG